MGIHFPQDKSWLETSNAEERPEYGGSGEAACHAAVNEPMVVARLS